MMSNIRTVSINYKKSKPQPELPVGHIHHTSLKYGCKTKKKLYNCIILRVQPYANVNTSEYLYLFSRSSSESESSFLIRSSSATGLGKTKQFRRGKKSRSRLFKLKQQLPNSTSFMFKLHHNSSVNTATTADNEMILHR